MRWIIAALGLLAPTVANVDVPDNRISFDQEWFDDRREISDKASLEDERAAAEYTYHKWVTCPLAALLGKFNYNRVRPWEWGRAHPTDWILPLAGCAYVYGWDDPVPYQSTIEWLLASDSAASAFLAAEKPVEEPVSTIAWVPAYDIEVVPYLSTIKWAPQQRNRDSRDYKLLFPWKRG